jgi:hypothetical protein
MSQRDPISLREKSKNDRIVLFSKEITLYPREPMLFVEFINKCWVEYIPYTANVAELCNFPTVTAAIEKDPQINLMKKI